MKTQPNQVNTPYNQALQGAAFYVLPHSGYVRIRGEDRLDFLQRQTSNDMRLLSEERALLTVLTSPAARILDVLYLVQESEHIAAITLPGRNGATIDFLKKRIFFMDKVTVEDLSQDFVQVELLGPRAEDTLKKLDTDPIPQVNQILQFQTNQGDYRVLATERSYSLGYRLLVPAESASYLIQTLEEVGAAPLGTEHHEILRIEAGLPAENHELTEDYTPLETGLRAAVSADKGCYTGQEVIARQITYDKVTQHLVGLKLESPASPGDRLRADGKAAGVITSSALSPRIGSIALAVVKRSFLDPGSELRVGLDADAPATAIVVALPF